MVDELASGNMPHSAQLLRDRFPLWRSPQVDAKLEKVSEHMVECAAGGLLGDFMAVRRQLLLWLGAMAAAAAAAAAAQLDQHLRQNLSNTTPNHEPWLGQHARVLV